MDYELVEDTWEFEPASTVWTGAIAVIVSNKSVSSAEHVAQMLQDLPNVVVVGQQSACTNGTITNFPLPGNFELGYGHAAHPDGSEFHGIGIVPDVEVVPTPAGAAGQDPELSAASRRSGEHL